MYTYRNVNTISITIQVLSFGEFFTTTSYVGSMNDKSYFHLSPYVRYPMYAKRAIWYREIVRKLGSEYLFAEYFCPFETLNRSIPSRALHRCLAFPSLQSWGESLEDIPIDDSILQI